MGNVFEVIFNRFICYISEEIKNYFYKDIIIIKTNDQRIQDFKNYFEKKDILLFQI